MSALRLAITLVLAFWFVSVMPAQAQDLQPFFGETTGAFVLYDAKNDRYTRQSVGRRAERFEGVVIGWFVGYDETNGRAYFFALNLEGSNFADIRDKRIVVTKQILTSLGGLPTTSSSLKSVGDGLAVM